MSSNEWFYCVMNDRYWYMYVVECSDRTLYTGVSNNLERRVLEHNASKKGAKYTRSRRPVKLVYYKKYDDRSQAQVAEYKFKKLSRSKKLAKIGGF